MSLKLLLIQPPLTDPTCGCAALPALSAYVRANSDHTVACVDANLESILHLVQPCHVGGVLDRAAAELAVRERGRVADGLSAESLSMRLIDLHLATTLSEDDPARAAAIFHDPSRFYDYNAYYWAAMTFQKWLGALAPPEIPRLYTNFCIRENLTEVNFRNIGKLLQPEVLELVTGSFASYIDETLVSRIREGGYDVIGLTVSFHDQLPFAIRICRRVRAELPYIRLLLGGAAISQMWKFGRATGAAQRVLAEVDAFVIGDGEVAIVEILDAIEAARPLDDIPNTVCLSNAERMHARRYVDLRSLPTPAVEDLPITSYLAPEPLVHYAPTRGCYWNRCTFCDYGLSEDSPTSPCRQRPIDAAVEDLKRLSTFARFICFSVDTISPAFLGALAKRIIEEGLDIRWNAEIRLDAPIRDDYFKTLRESGCVAVSVGFESGNQRILDLMDKGVLVDRMVANIRGMADAGIGVQIMGFTGFPTETFNEAIESINLLKDLEDSWVFGGLGTFHLTAGAIVAKAPREFGIHNLRFRPDDDLLCLVDYDEMLPSKTPEEKAKVLELTGGLKKAFQLDRPFVGGTDAPHTLMYIDRYSLAVREELRKGVCGEAFDVTWPITLSGVLTDWWPSPNAAAEGGREEGGEYHIICDDRTVFSCGSAAAEVATLLMTPRPLSEVLDQIMARPGLERFLLIQSFKELTRTGLVKAVPFEAQEASYTAGEHLYEERNPA